MTLNVVVVYVLRIENGIKIIQNWKILTNILKLMKHSIEIKQFYSFEKNNVFISFQSTKQK